MITTSLIVTDHRALIRLALAAELDALVVPDTRLLIPDAVRYWLILDIAKPGAVEALEWMRENEDHVHVRSTEELEEHLVLRNIGAAESGQGRPAPRQTMRQPDEEDMPENEERDGEGIAMDAASAGARKHEELAAGEVLGRELAKGMDAIILLFDDAAGFDGGSLLRQIPDNVVMLSASAYLKSLKANQVGSLNWLFRRILSLGRPQHD